VPNVVKPDLFAVRRLEERGAEPVEVERCALEAPGLALSLDQDALRAHGQPLGPHDADDPVVEPEGVVGRALEVGSSSLLWLWLRCTGEVPFGDVRQPPASSLGSMRFFRVCHSFSSEDLAIRLYRTSYEAG
jgi:hypothetical protein